MPHATCCQFSSPDCALFCCQSVWQLLKSYIAYRIYTYIVYTIPANWWQLCSQLSMSVCRIMFTQILREHSEGIRGIFTCNIRTYKVKRKNILKYFMHFINQILTNLIIVKWNSNRYYFHLLLANRIETQSDPLNGFANRVPPSALVNSSI